MRLEDFGFSQQPVQLGDQPLDADNIFGTLAPDSFFGSLDGRTVRCGGRSWRIVVFSVSEGAGHRWVQLALRGASDYALALRLNGDEGVGQVMRLVTNWLASGIDNPNIIRATAELRDRVHDAAPCARRGAIGVGDNGSARPRVFAGRGLPN